MTLVFKYFKNSNELLFNLVTQSKIYFNSITSIKIEKHREYLYQLFAKYT